MHIIPVIDVRHGVAVRAVAGERAKYRPLKTPLAASPDPIAVAQGLRLLFPFDALYIADLDGIEGRGRNAGLAAGLGAALPDAGLWIDDGTAAGRRPFRTVSQVTIVIGSESIRPEDLLVMRSDVDDEGTSRADAGALSPHLILSLDFRGDEFLGPPELLANANLWPERVIVMTLARVGGQTGPDLGKLADIAARAGSARRVYAAGGVRHLDDLRAARGAGAHGALIASALHAGTIKAGGLERAAGL